MNPTSIAQPPTGPPSFDLVRISAQNYEAMRALVRELSGIELGESKNELVVSRLRGRLAALGLDGFDAYLDLVRGPRASEELCHLIDAISTNVTSFHREPGHFAALRAFLEERRNAGVRRIRIWSAAAATGQEPYEIAMCLHDVFADRVGAVDAKVLATDISGRALEVARCGRYATELVDPLPEPLRSRYLRRVEGESAWEVRESVRTLVTFARLNLARPPYPMRGPFDVVFCRNVMIYFDEPARRALLAECHRLLDPDGLLFVASSEAAVPNAGPFRAVTPSQYRPAPVNHD